MQTEMVRDGYDKVARQYLGGRERLKTGKYIKQLLKLLPRQSSILDLGCGAGVPVDDILLTAGHMVIGIDISREQIKLARKYCKQGQYLVGDIATLSPNEYQVQAVISFYALFHLPRSIHSKILQTWVSFLPTNGLLLVTMGDREFEGRHDLYGVSMWSSQYGTAKNRQMIERLGMKILSDSIDTSGGERHQIILSQKY